MDAEHTCPTWNEAEYYSDDLTHEQPALKYLLGVV